MIWTLATQAYIIPAKGKKHWLYLLALLLSLHSLSTSYSGPSTQKRQAQLSEQPFAPKAKVARGISLQSAFRLIRKPLPRFGSADNLTWRLTYFHSHLSRVQFITQLPSDTSRFITRLSQKVPSPSEEAPLS